MKPVSRRDMDDWRKLKRCLGFAKSTIKDKSIISADRTDTLLFWIDGAHAVHSNMRGHTGGCISMCLGIIHGKSA